MMPTALTNGIVFVVPDGGIEPVLQQYPVRATEGGARLRVGAATPVRRDLWCHQHPTSVLRGEAAKRPPEGADGRRPGR